MNLNETFNVDGEIVSPKSRLSAKKVEKISSSIE
jgi:hypothetical protein